MSVKNKAHKGALSEIKSALKVTAEDEGTPELTDENAQAQLAEALGLTTEQLTPSSDPPYSWFGQEVKGFETDSGEEWLIVANEDDAREIALAVVQEDLENEPGIFNQEWLMGQIDEQRALDFFRSMYDEWNKSYAYDIKSEDSMGEYKNRLVEEMVDREIVSEEDAKSEGFDEDRHIDAFVQHMTDDQIEEGNGGYNYYVDNFGKEEANTLVMNHNLIDIDEAAEEAVSADGWPHFISRVSGTYEETPVGFVYWREN